MKGNPMIDNVESKTAKLCSFARAYHSNQERQKIFDDYLAYDLMGQEEYEEIGQMVEHGYREDLFDPAKIFSRSGIREQLNRHISPIPLSRADFTEKELWNFAWEKGRCQYVICGAGMDTFAFRNTNPDIQVFEIDHPDTQQYKLERIRKLCWNIPENVHFVPVDFAEDNMAKELKKACFDPKVPSFFAILGVTYYLDLAVFEETVDKISKISAFGSKLIFDFPDDTTFLEGAAERVRWLADLTASLGEPMVHGYSTEEVDRALLRHGFLTDEHLTPEKIQKRFFQNREDRQEAYENIHFLLAKKESPANEEYYLYI